MLLKGVGEGNWREREVEKKDGKDGALARFGKHAAVQKTRTDPPCQTRPEYARSGRTERTLFVNFVFDILISLPYRS